MFGFNFDKKTIYIILAILVIWILIDSGTDFLLTTCLTLPGVIIAITFHEFAHAYAADKLGDTTPRLQGRLTLDPKAHIDPFGIILLIFAHIGWGKPVQINPRNFNSNKSTEKCEAIVSLAGPLMNFFLAFVFEIICVIMIYFFAVNPSAYTLNSTVQVIFTIISYTVTVNIGLGVFNLIPIPPLDGEKIFRLVLPYNTKRWIDNNMQTIEMIFMVLWITGLLGKIVSPIITWIETGYFFVVAKIIGLIIGIFV